MFYSLDLYLSLHVFSGKMSRSNDEYDKNWDEHENVNSFMMWRRVECKIFNLISGVCVQMVNIDRMLVSLIKKC